jgi:hypothetical protein
MTNQDDHLAYQHMLDKKPQIESLTQTVNESTTRLRAIDTILFDVLFWDKNHVETEKYCRAEGYADYVFSINQKPSLVLEAKKSGIDFLIPERSFQNRPYAFGLLAKECESACSAFQQAIGYAATLGSRYIAICNGHQWLFGLTFIQDQPLENRLVYVFESLDAILKHFRNFYLCFSPSGVEHNSVAKELLDTLRQPAPAKLSSSIPGYPLTSTRNIFQNELSYILDYVWQIMSQEEGTPAFVENCYVNPNSHEDILTLARELIEKRRNEDNILTNYEIETIDKLPYKLANLPAEKPFIILGEIGRGKTSFLKYLRFVSAKELLYNYIQIEVNFIDRPDNFQQIPDYIYQEIERQLRDNYSIDIYENSFVRGVLHADLMRLRKTPKGTFYANDKEKYKEFELTQIDQLLVDKHLYLTKVFHHLKKGRQCSIALFFDNLDRRDEQIQEHAFLKASSMARDWSSLIFIALRPKTYYESRQINVLDSIAPMTFTVGQPDLSLVLKRRFAYAKRVAQGDSLDDAIIRGVLSKAVSFDLPQVAMFFDACEFSAWKRRGIIPMLEAVSNGNIRRLLDLARKILCSGHLNTQKIIDAIRLTGSYSIPDFEGVKTLLYGDYNQYDPFSPFINLFDIQYHDPTEHFLRLSILNYLAKIPYDSPSGGYVNASQLIEFLSTLGYSYNVSIQTLNILAEKQCIRKTIETDYSITDEDNIRITWLGKYHIHKLARMFQYIDAITIDTPITEPKTRASIQNVTDLTERLKRTKSFINYIDQCATQVRDEEVKILWQDISSDVKKDITEVIKNNITRKIPPTRR